ncbi:MAG: RecQ family ATP-dependent DNA helicase [Cytophagaceae bacterium]|nr:RecQ family ATP-dependent DNA helicase [Cytophagaceae bacterium]
MVTPEQVLKKYWNYDGFRPKQKEVVEAVMQGKPVLALLPTGGGKSICYQVPGLCKPGLTLVVSPLLSLMKDQVERLRQLGIKAYYLHSGMHYREMDIVLDNCSYDSEVKFLYVSPERLQSELFQERIKKMPLQLLAVDEAHCISQWGHDFRPAYRHIGDLLQQRPGLQVIAVTATATPAVILDIQQQLAIPHAECIQDSYIRKNLSLSCLQPENKDHKLLEILKKVPGSAIVYMRSRKGCEALSKWLRRNAVVCDYYHAGVPLVERNRKQQEWLKGAIRVMVATNAFGMGIDKADVRLVVHMDIPDNPESYFQEAGRAGRDGQRAFAVQLFHDSDYKELQEKIEQKYPSNEIVRNVYQALANHYKIAVGSSMLASYDFQEEEFARIFKFTKIEMYYALRRLEQEGYIQMPDFQDTQSKLMIIVDAMQLYDYQLTHPGMDTFIKTLLRLYGGELYTGFVSIQEQQVMRILGMSEIEFKKKMDILQKSNMLLYEPRKIKPQVLFTQPRQDASRLFLSAEKQEQLRKVDRERALYMIQYTQLQKGCRNQFLLRYFGEILAQPCGICDLCLADTKDKKQHAQSLNQKIIQCICEKPQMLQDVVEQMKGIGTEAQVVEALRDLLDNDQIEYVNGTLISIKKR